MQCNIAGIEEEDTECVKCAEDSFDYSNEVEGLSLLKVNLTLSSFISVVKSPFLWATVLQTGPTYLQVDHLCVCVFSPFCYWSIPQILASHWWTLMRH